LANRGDQQLSLYTAKNQQILYGSGTICGAAPKPTDRLLSQTDLCCGLLFSWHCLKGEGK
jgi:hypothetical protein